MARRRSRSTDAPVAEEAAVSDELVLGVLHQLQSIDQRLTRVEELLAETELDRLAQAEQRDLIDLRLHSARLAAELSRVTVDLQARIDAVASDRPPPPSTEQDTVAVDHLPPPVTGESTPAWEPIVDD
ncbi:MAG: hypothetical protein ACR2QE_15415 [Acidimicrobiales bacterium]